MTSSLTVVRKGSQLPRFESYPAFFTTAADDAVDIAAVAGLNLDPWQEYVLRAALGERKDGRWSAFRTCLVVPRQNGKNAILEARELAGLLLFGEKVIVHTAHQFKTANNSMIALMNRIKGCELIDYVRGGSGVSPDTDIRDIDGFKTGNQPSITMVTRVNGKRVEPILQFAARSSDSGRGFTGDLVVLDEAYALKASEMAALLPTMSAKSITGNPQLWFTSSAGMPESDLLAGLREQGMSKSADRLAYFEWSAADDADMLDKDSWYESNPALGYRISEEFIQDEYDTFMTAGASEEFKRERLGIWAPLGSEPAFPLGVWAGQVAPAQPLTNPVMAIDMRSGLNQSVSFAVAGGTLTGSQVHIAKYESGFGRRWSHDYVVSLALELLHDRGMTTVAIDKYAENETLIVQLVEAGIDVIKLNRDDMANAAVAFTGGLINGQVWHSPNAELDAAVAGAAKRTYRETLYLWSPLKSTADITPLRAANAAWWVYTSGATSQYDPLDSVF